MDLRAPLPAEHSPSIFRDNVNTLGRKRRREPPPNSGVSAVSKVSTVPTVPTFSTSQAATLSSELSSPTAFHFHATYENILHQLLCRMHIASQVMELGSESRFTGLILFHRYCRHVYGSAKDRLDRLDTASRIDEKSKRSENSTESLTPDNLSGDDNKECQEESPPEQLVNQQILQDLKQFKKHLGLVAATCIFLGCKMEEEPKRIRDVINVSFLLDFCGWNDSLISSDADDVQDEKKQRAPMIIVESEKLPPLDESYWQAKEQTVSIEQHVLRMLQFDALVSHPHRCVLVIMDTLGFGTGLCGDGIGVRNGNSVNSILKPDQSECIILRAWRILNEASLDAQGTALQYPVVVLACSSISLAAEGFGCSDCVFNARSSEDAEQTRHSFDNGGNINSKVELPDVWWQALDVSTEDLSAASLALRSILES